MVRNKIGIGFTAYSRKELPDFIDIKELTGEEIKKLSPDEFKKYNDQNTPKTIEINKPAGYNFAALVEDYGSDAWKIGYVIRRLKAQMVRYSYNRDSMLRDCDGKIVENNSKVYFMLDLSMINSESVIILAQTLDELGYDVYDKVGGAFSRTMAQSGRLAMRAEMSRSNMFAELDLEKVERLNDTSRSVDKELLRREEILKPVEREILRKWYLRVLVGIIEDCIIDSSGNIKLNIKKSEASIRGGEGRIIEYVINRLKYIVVNAVRTNKRDTITIKDIDIKILKGLANKEYSDESFVLNLEIQFAKQIMDWNTRLYGDISKYLKENGNVRADADYKLIDINLPTIFGSTRMLELLKDNFLYATYHDYDFIIKDDGERSKLYFRRMMSRAVYTQIRESEPR
jgi:hypothetical protein